MDDDGDMDDHEDGIKRQFIACGCWSLPLFIAPPVLFIATGCERQ